MSAVQESLGGKYLSSLVVVMVNHQRAAALYEEILINQTEGLWSPDLIHDSLLYFRSSSSAGWKSPLVFCFLTLVPLKVQEDS